MRRSPLVQRLEITSRILLLAGAMPARAHGPRHFSKPDVPASLMPEWSALSPVDKLLFQPATETTSGMLHSGLPEWVSVVTLALCCAISIWFLLFGMGDRQLNTTRSLQLPFLIRSVRLRITLKILAALLFVLAIYGGLNGVHWPEINLATILVWHWWWPLVVISVFLFGSFWCTICPWNSFAQWLTPGKLKGTLPAPRWLKTIYPALALFLGFTWLELGWGLAHDPAATAWLSLAILLLSLLFILRYEKRIFCRSVCPVGRTLGFYSRLAPVGVSPTAQSVCDSCTTLDCYYGSGTTEPCPTSLAIGRTPQNTYCISCGNCAISCPHNNVTWGLRSLAAEAEARPRRDESLFMLVLLGVTLFHGMSMLPGFPIVLHHLADFLGENGKPMWATLILLLTTQLPVLALYGLAIITIQRLSATPSTAPKAIFDRLAFSSLPITFSYHIAHNLGHLSRERAGLGDAILNPTGAGREPADMMQWHRYMTNPWLPDAMVHLLQGSIIFAGFALSVRILWRRGVAHGGEFPAGWRLSPMLGFVFLSTWLSLWLLSQNMLMRF